ncbi:MAG: hypothetical protein HY079_05975 [Elusimicrobia bacterium]|nr:hypothetical protein [Elusimicrobiota bacterium]
MNPAERPPVWFRYTFVAKDGGRKAFEVRLDPTTMRLLDQPAEETLPEWTRLDAGKCGNCPLKSETTPRCPAAVSLAGVVEGFRDVLSYEEGEVIVESEGRTTTKRAAVQRTLPSLIGLYMACSGCPILEKLKPMARFHLPFAGLDETAYRVVTMYAAAQVVRARKGLAPDFSFDGLRGMYDEINKVNADFCGRLRLAAHEDSLFNSIVSLDLFAAVIKMPQRGRMEEVFDLFKGYLRDEPPPPPPRG